MGGSKCENVLYLLYKSEKQSVCPHFLAVWILVMAAWINVRRFRRDNPFYEL